jgi:hypothetical protein
MPLLSVTHENDVRRTLRTLREMHFEPLWLIRLYQAGAPRDWIRGAELFALFALIGAACGVATLLLETGKRTVTQ